MTEQDRLRFSVQLTGATDLSSWSDKVRRAEDSGFYSVSIPDHLDRSQPQLAPLVAMGAAAAVTSRVRLALTVLDNDFRHPVMLAKEIATLDLLSAGRVDMGLGAGWLEEDYTRTGVATWDPPGVRVDRLIESIALVKQLLDGGPVTFKGAHYRVDGHESYPPPAQRPIPLVIGGGGRRMLSMAAREAQIISVLVRLRGDRDTRRASFEEQLRWIDEAGGRDRDDLVLGVRVLFGEVLAPAASRDLAAERLAAESSMSAAEVLDSPFGLVGDLSALKDHVLAAHERYGISYFTVSEDLAWALAPLVADLAA